MLALLFHNITKQYLIKCKCEQYCWSKKILMQEKMNFIRAKIYLHKTAKKKIVFKLFGHKQIWAAIRKHLSRLRGMQSIHKVLDLIRLSHLKIAQNSHVARNSLEWESQATIFNIKNFFRNSCCWEYTQSLGRKKK